MHGTGDESRIRSGEMDVETPGLLPALHAMAMNQLAIDQPVFAISFSVSEVHGLLRPRAGRCLR